HLQGARFAAQRHQLFALGAGHALATTLIDVGPGHPAAQAALGDAEVAGQLADRLGPLASELDGALAELWWMGRGHAGSVRGATTSVQVAAQPGDAQVA